MGQVLHGSATTTEATRRAIQHSQARLRALARRFGVNPKTVAKWRSRATTADRRTGPKQPRSTVLTAEQETIVVALRQHTLAAAGRLPVCAAAHHSGADPLVAASLPSAPWHQPAARDRRRQACSAPLQELPDWLLSHRHRRGPHRAEGRLYLFVAIDRTSKFAYIELHEKATLRVSGDFLRALIRAVPYRIHTVLTDHGIHFTTPSNVSSAAPDIRLAIERGEPFRAHAFELACAQNSIDHRLTKPRCPWTNGQVERMNRTLKDATVRRYHYDTHEQLRTHLADFVMAYNFARRLKRLGGLTPYEFICKAYQTEPQRFTLDPLHQMPGLNI